MKFSIKLFGDILIQLNGLHKFTLLCGVWMGVIKRGGGFKRNETLVFHLAHRAGFAMPLLAKD